MLYAVRVAVKNIPCLDDFKKIVQEALDSKVDSLKEFIEKQNSFIVELIAQNSALLKKLVSVEQDVSKVVKDFPIETVEELMELEQKLDEKISLTYVAALRKIIFPSGISKTFPMLFKKEIFLNYNYDGIKGKSAFKELKKINDVLFRAIDTGDLSMADYIQQIRKAFKLSKNAHFKNVCINKQNIN